MITRTLSGTIQGVDVFTVDIEADCSDDSGAMEKHFNIIGLPDAAVRESRDRVRSALWANGIPMPRGNITVNLAPASLRKSGALYDLPIALCLSAQGRFFDPKELSDTFIVGELGLNGEVRSVPGALPMALHAKFLGLKRILLPLANAREASAVRDIQVYGIANILDAIGLLRKTTAIAPVTGDLEALFRESQQKYPDFVDVKGQETAKRALTIAAAGNHNLMMIGQPGTGKSLIASRIPGIMPQMGLSEAMEVTRLYSIAGLMQPGSGLITTRPFRAPHHTVSDAGLMGGGNGIPRPGEITLAHRGVLFLDELPEFRRNVLESLRQPLENGKVTIARAAGSFTFPSRFMLVAAMNPCPCGYYGSINHRCKCSPFQVAAYRSRISGPLLDRMDMHIEVPPLPDEVLLARRTGATSQELRQQVMAARAIQVRRFAGTDIPDNAGIQGSALDRFCALDEEGKLYLRQALRSRDMSARSYDRILRVARTIADLEGTEFIQVHHLAEACQYRILDRGESNQYSPPVF